MGLFSWRKKGVKKLKAEAYFRLKARVLELQARRAQALQALQLIEQAEIEAFSAVGLDPKIAYVLEDKTLTATPVDQKAVTGVEYQGQARSMPETEG